MSPLWPALLATLSAGLALRGVLLLRARGPAHQRLAALPDLVSTTRTGPLTRLVRALAARLGPRLGQAAGEQVRARIHRDLDRAGRPGGLGVQEFLGRVGAFAVLALLLGVLLALSGAVMAAALLLPLGLFGPWIWLSRAGRLRQERLQRDLPDFLDVLSVTVRAGLTYRLALARVAESLGGPAGDEIITMLRQMDLGATRRNAFLALRDRNDSDALSGFVTAQLQAEELGVPLADALNDIALDVRKTAHQDARKRAQRASPRVSLIITTIIVPASIILILTALFLGSDLDAGAIL